MECYEKTYELYGYFSSPYLEIISQFIPMQASSEISSVSLWMTSKYSHKIGERLLRLPCAVGNIRATEYPHGTIDSFPRGERNDENASGAL